MSEQRQGSRIVERVATPEEHARLSEAVGWEHHFDDEVRAASLQQSLAGVVWLDDRGEAIGMARAVGDGWQYAYIQDVIVDPAHSGEGGATQLVTRLIELLRPTDDAELFVGLFASPEAEGVYTELGFTSEEALGMHRRIRSATVSAH